MERCLIEQWGNNTEEKREKVRWESWQVGDGARQGDGLQQWGGGDGVPEVLSYSACDAFVVS